MTYVRTSRRFHQQETYAEIISARARRIFPRYYAAPAHYRRNARGYGAGGRAWLRVHTYTYKTRKREDDGIYMFRAADNVFRIRRAAIPIHTHTRTQAHVYSMTEQREILYTRGRLFARMKRVTRLYNERGREYDRVRFVRPPPTRHPSPVASSLILFAGGEGCNKRQPPRIRVCVRVHV